VKQLKKQQWILIGITGIFLCLLVGIFVGRNLTGAYVPIDNAINTTGQNTTDEPQDNNGKIDLNTATLQQLQLLPGVGETIAQRILDYRSEHNSFNSVEDLMNVSGIGEKKFEQIKPYVKVGGNYEDSGS